MADLPKWPSFLPCPIAYSTDFSPSSGVESQAMETGMLIQRRKFAGLPGPVSRAFILTDAQANIVAAFHEAYATSEFLVELSAPGRFGELKAYRCRVLKFPAFTAHAPGKQRCVVELHIAALDVPSLADLAVPGTEFIGPDGDAIAGLLNLALHEDAPKFAELED